MLTDDDFKEAAKRLGCDVETIKAVTKVETNGEGFDDKGNLKMLFEPYIFYKRLKKEGYEVDELKEKYPSLLSDHWNPKMYGKFSDQINKLKGAANINTEIAYQSASYGLFQIMGFNAEDIGYEDVFEMYYSFLTSLREQLLGFCNFVKYNNLEKYLQNKDWENFAKRYNGPSYKENKYDTKLEKEYAKLRS